MSLCKFLSYYQCYLTVVISLFSFKKSLVNFIFNSFIRSSKKDALCVKILLEGQTHLNHTMNKSIRFIQFLYNLYNYILMSFKYEK